MAILVTVNVIVLTSLSSTNSTLKETQSMVIKTKSALETRSKDVQELSKEKMSISSSLKETSATVEKLKSENESLKENLQAKKDAEQALITAQETQQLTIQKQSDAVVVSGTCEDWLAMAGISDLVNARDLINRESGCNPNAVNPSSGACGVAQELPCGKSGCSLGDGACQVAWMKKYVEGRYGSFANAIAFHKKNNWY